MPIRYYSQIGTVCWLLPFCDAFLLGPAGQELLRRVFLKRVGGFSCPGGGGGGSDIIMRPAPRGCSLRASLRFLYVKRFRPSFSKKI